MLVLGNRHLGPDIWSFSIPAFATCPGCSFPCLAVCTAMRGHYMHQAVRDFHRENWERSLDPPRFQRDMIREIKSRFVRDLRVHVAGDFYDVPYVQSWTRIVRRCRTTTFLAYTRSWRRPELLDPLVELSRLPNMRMFWSEDAQTGACDRPEGRRAFLCATAADELVVPREPILVFRDDTRSVRKWFGPAWVCPKEQGTPTLITCSACRRCLLPDPLPRNPRKP
jgi:hypothetical protein